MLTRFDPFRPLDQLMWQATDGGYFGVPMDAYRRGDQFVVELDLPGVDRDSIDVTVERNVLEVTAQRAAHYGDDDHILVAERPQGTVTRQLFLDRTLDTGGIQASYDEGVLTLSIPVRDEAKPHKVQISAGSATRAVEAGS